MSRASRRRSRRSPPRAFVAQQRQAGNRHCRGPRAIALSMIGVSASSRCACSAWCGRHRRLDHRGEAHLRVEAAGLEGRPAGIARAASRPAAHARARCCSGSSSRAVFTLPPAICEWMSIAPAITILPVASWLSSAARAGRRLDDAARRRSTHRRCRRAPLRGIDDAPAGDAGQHGQAPRGSAAAISRDHVGDATAGRLRAARGARRRACRSPLS